VFLVVDSLLLFVMCTVTLQRLRDSITQIYTFIIIIIIIKTTWPNFINFFLLIGSGRAASSYGAAIRQVFPVLWITSRFHTVDSTPVYNDAS